MSSTTLSLPIASQWFGELGILAKTTRTASAYALSRCELLMVSRQVLKSERREKRHREVGERRDGRPESLSDRGKGGERGRQTERQAEREEGREREAERDEGRQRDRRRERKAEDHVVGHVLHALPMKTAEHSTSSPWSSS